MWILKSPRSADLIGKALDLMADGLMIFDRKDRLWIANRAVESLSGVERQELVGRRIEAIIERFEAVADSASDLGALRRHLREATQSTSLQTVLSDGRRLTIEARVVRQDDRIAGRLWELRDPAAARRAEQAAVDVRKLESLGVLAGGIAHDFNNLLSSILGHTELGLDEVEADSEVAESLRSIAHVAERASQLTQKMLAYAGKGTVLVEPIDLSQVVRDVLDLVSVSLRSDIELELELVHDLPPIIADVVQIRQVVMNLVLNAAEASEKGGAIEISTGAHRLVQSDIDSGVGDPETTPGEFVYLEVVDSGHGMDAATLERIFDPFFSTKFTGRGLGLAAVHGIVRGHRGLLRVTSRPGRGTTFTVDLPRGYANDSTTPQMSS